MTTYTQWNDAADWYNQNMGESGDTMNAQIIGPAILEMLGDLSSKDVLDSGCGSGYFSAELAKSAKTVVGSDFSQNFVSICQQKYAATTNLSFVQHDVTTEMPFADAKFDVVISKMVLQYVDDISAFAQQSFRVLRNQGKLIIAIDHPFHTQYYYAQQQLGKTFPKYPELNDYFSTRPCNKLSLWGKVELTWYPRTVSEYITIFLQPGFNLDKLEELQEKTGGVTLPRILVLCFCKSQ